MIARTALILVALFLSVSAHAQALVVSSCGAIPQAYPAGGTRQLTVDVNGKLCLTGGGAAIVLGTTVITGGGANNVLSDAGGTVNETPIGTSGAVIPLTNGANTWSATQTFADSGTWSSTGISTASLAVTGSTCSGTYLYSPSANQIGVCVSSVANGLITASEWRVNRSINGTNEFDVANPNAGVSAQAVHGWRNSTSTAAADCTAITLNGGGFSGGLGGGAFFLDYDVANACTATKFYILRNSVQLAVWDTNGALTIGSASGLTVPASGIGLTKITADGAAPGAAGAKLELVCGTNAGSAKLIAYAGTSATPVTIVDNIGAGVTGC